MFKGILADSVIELAYMTGILPIKKYGTQSALNNFDEYTMLDPTPNGRIYGLYGGRSSDNMQAVYDGL